MAESRLLARLRRRGFALCIHSNKLSLLAQSKNGDFLTVVISKTCGSVWVRDLSLDPFFALDKSYHMPKATTAGRVLKEAIQILSTQLLEAIELVC